MKNAIVLLIHLLAGLALLLGTGGTRAVLAENILYMANCHSSGDWQFKQSVAVALPAVILKAGGLRGWAARFLPGRVAG